MSRMTKFKDKILPFYSDIDDICIDQGLFVESFNISCAIRPGQSAKTDGRLNIFIDHDRCEWDCLIDKKRLNEVRNRIIAFLKSNNVNCLVNFKIFGC